MCDDATPRRVAAMDTTTLLLRSSAVLAAGGLAWLAKLGVIAATDGRVTSTGAAAVLFVAGVVLMPIGLAGVGVALTARRHVVARVGAAGLGLLAFFALFSVVDGAAGGVVGDAGPAWLGDEAGILATGAALAAAGLLLARRAQDA